MQFLIAFARWFTSDTVAIGLPILILAAALLCGWWFCRRPYRRLADALGAAKKSLQSCASAEEFAAHFPALSEELANTPGLRAGWRTLRRQLDHDPRKGVILSTDEVAYHIDPESVIQRVVDTRWLGTIPNLLTGVGILGTFLGLACGILLAKDGLVSHDATETTAALQALFGGASVAFWKSVAGLIASMVFTTVERRSHRTAVMAVEDVSALLSGLIHVVTPAQLVARQLEGQHAANAPIVSVLTEQLSVMQEQTNQLKTFNSKLVVSLKEALEDSYARRMQDSFTKILERVERLSETIGRTGSDMVGTLSDTFRSSLASTIGGNVDVQLSGLDGLREMLTMLAPTLESTRREFEGSTRRLVEEVATMMSTTRSTAEQHMKSSAGTMEDTLRLLAEKSSQQASQMQAIMVELQQASARMATQMEESATRAQMASQEKLAQLTQLVSETFQSTGTRMGSELERAGASLAQQSQEQAGRISQQASQMQAIMTDLQQSSARMAAQMEESATRAQMASQEKLAQLTQQVSEAFQSTGTRMGSEFERAGASLAQQSQEHAGRISGVAEKLEAVVEKWAQSLGQSGKFADGMSQLVARLDESQSGFQAATKALGSAATTLSGSSSHIVAFGERSESVVQRVEQIQASIERATQQCASSWNDYRGRFEGIDQSLARTFEHFNSGLVRCQQIVDEFMKSVDQHMTKAITGLGAVVTEMSDGVEELPEQVKLMGGQVVQLKDAMEQLRRALPEARR